jgi:hypothetical protein
LLCGAQGLSESQILAALRGPSRRAGLSLTYSKIITFCIAAAWHEA